MTTFKRLALASAATFVLGACATAQSTPDFPLERAKKTSAQMVGEERVQLTWGIMPLAIGDGTEIPEDAIPGAGYISGIPRLGVPALKETDASLGVSYVGGLRGDYSTALPSGMAQGATFNTDLIEIGGATIGREAHSKGFNVLLAGGMNLIRDPRGGRTFEYLGEDPLHSGLMAAASVRGIQSEHVISTLKHFALNDQETGRHFVDIKIDDDSARESDLLAFQIAIEKGQPGSIMCAYNKVNEDYACGNNYLLNSVLKEDWGYKGWVMSDWGAVHGLEDALNGLDQQSGSQLDKDLFFHDKLLQAAETDPAYDERLTDMNERVLWGIYSVGVDANPPVIRDIDFDKNAHTAQKVAEEGIVLLKNDNGTLPLTGDETRIAVIGGYADSGVLSGGGSSNAQTEGGPALALPLGGDGPFAMFMTESYHRSAPLKALKTKAPETTFSYRRGDYIANAVETAKNSDVAIIFATQWMTEGIDVASLALPRGQDELISAIAKANPNTIVVLETGGPVDMPWIDEVAGVVEAWYPGMRGAEAIANILYGDVNPSGRLPVTFPKSEDQLPRPMLDGFDMDIPSFAPHSDTIPLEVDYSIEGSDIGYRWFAKKRIEPLFPFGYGLSYTSFAQNDLSISGDATKLSASLSVTNTGDRAGMVTPQVYLVSVNGETKQRLVGFSKVDLAAGQSQQVNLVIDPRILAEWENDGWSLAAGDYSFAIGNNAADLKTPVTVFLHARQWTD
ncbi:beta-glucosidase [Hyphomonas pacifica]|uniref:Fibronectin type III-like domain-containing protein n=1 Tax=Hyphomonas pacifica TaxID=1280941 RepID=A0A062TVF1_9PROT|nr:glycoside hydrolase family 3 protein [Hyphomonas pacifica]KCZ47293.1 hypothetical protein HY2_16580 [Hyphomonas pacifica]RAN31237.1 hypothetical protein HY3_16955 [Hyphomonas pacifica]